MNRKQAEHILDAYTEMECAGGDNKTRQSLREVILDAMTEYRYSTITVPNVINSQPAPNYVKPYVTW